MMQISVLFLISFFLNPSLSEDAVDENMGTHQLMRLVDLLTVHECEELLLTLSHPEENIFNQLDRLSEEKNVLRLPSRRQRDLDKDFHCRPALIDWLQSFGKQTYLNRLSRALQQIRRTDIAIEVGKNINQDKALSMQRYVEEYHERINKMQSNLPQTQAEAEHHEEMPCCSEKQERSLTLEDLDLVVKRNPVPPYQHCMLDAAKPLIYGLILGFGSALLVGMSLLVIVPHLYLCGFSRKFNFKSQHQLQNIQCYSSTLSERILLKQEH
ncbi:transmembrane and death domain protein 1-like [Trichomycterus rosablanca]|uniref:transmembrane and death domain protein 1-like n=1 Tax=Trichomycterus rosablanca TaxID=2290929 RepID=UPI002F35AF6B